MIGCSRKCFVFYNNLKESNFRMLEQLSQVLRLATFQKCIVKVLRVVNLQYCVVPLCDKKEISHGVMCPFRSCL